MSRAEYIKQVFHLVDNRDGSARAEWRHPDGSLRSVIEGEHDEVRRKARARWGHFNFQDEADTFDSIFR